MRLRLKVNGVDLEVEADETPPLPSLGPFSAKDTLVPVEESPRTDYDKRMGIQAKHYLTVQDPIDTTWIVDRCKEHITGKNVVEIGAGVGYLAVALAAHAHHVWAIEVDVKWSWEFAEKLYATKPRNLTWIFDRAENLVDVIKADVAIVVTGSDEVWLRELAGRFAPKVIMPWQDWNHGKAVISNFRGLE